MCLRAFVHAAPYAWNTVPSTQYLSFLRPQRKYDFPSKLSWATQAKCSPLPASPCGAEDKLFSV